MNVYTHQTLRHTHTHTTEKETEQSYTMKVEPNYNFTVLQKYTCKFTGKGTKGRSI